MELNEALLEVWSAITNIERIDFDQTGEEIKEDLLGIHRPFLKRDGVMDKVINCLQELQAVVDEYKSTEEELGIDLVTFAELNKTDKIYDKEEETFMFFNWIDLKKQVFSL